VRHDGAYASLRGLSLGDAFGEQWFFRPRAEMDWMVAERALPAGPWRWTDDTAMAVTLYRVLATHGEVRQDELARRFAETYDAEPHRGYGPSMHGVLRAILDGEPWPSVTASQFGGQGSWGNGAAMRVAPLGAFFADDLDRVAEQAHRSAVVTHAHPEAAAGAVAVAVATAAAARGLPASDLFSIVVDATPPGEVRSRLRRAADRPSGAPRATSTTSSKHCGPRRRPVATSTRPARSVAASSPPGPVSKRYPRSGSTPVSRCHRSRCPDRTRCRRPSSRGNRFRYIFRRVR
jgi:ADP-ribosylglycohydrolase